MGITKPVHLKYDLEDRKRGGKKKRQLGHVIAGVAQFPCLPQRREFRYKGREATLQGVATQR